mmetsp:Transcript_33021/g.104493  ORF Transcript_33021/g.104493 Transcript_33021/m.104493 type:complete len:311 (-) Transcript_33021:1013-1945(-)
MVTMRGVAAAALLMLPTTALVPTQLQGFTKGLSFSSGKKTPFGFTHLEVNAMIWKTNGLSVLVDPIAGQLDFGIPLVYKANQVVLDEDACMAMIQESKPDVVLLTQGLDDHTHLPTMEKVLKLFPEVKVIAAPSAAGKVSSLGLAPGQLTVLSPGEDTEFVGGSCSKLRVRATEGALVGPPWQARENGYLVETEQGPSVYYEPHADVEPAELKAAGLKADVVISPTTAQKLPGFTLVYGGDRTLDIAEALGAQVVVPLRNGELKAEGPLAGLIEAEGADAEAFAAQAKARGVTVAPTVPGKKVDILVNKA